MIEFLNKSNIYNFKIEKLYYNLLYDYLILKDIENIDGDDNIINTILIMLSKFKLEKNIKYNNYLIYFIIYIFHKRQFKNNNKNPHSKDIFYKSILGLYDYEPNIILYIIYYDLISVYGYCKDYFNLWKVVLKKIELEYKVDLKSPIKTRCFKIAYNKYNPLMIAFANIINHKKNRDLNNVNEHIINNYNRLSYSSSTYNIDINWFSLGVFGLQHLEHISRNILIDSHFKYNKYTKNIKISKISIYIPRQNKSKDIFWFFDYNEFKKDKKMKRFYYKKVNVFDYLILYNKICNNNFNDIQVNNNDRKRFRIDCSILNRINDTPQIHMCNSKLSMIDFNKCGYKFLKNTKNLLLMKDKKTKNIINTTTENTTTNLLFDKEIAKNKYLSFIKHSATKYNYKQKKIILSNHLFYCDYIPLLFKFTKNELNIYINKIILKNKIVYHNNYKSIFFLLKDANTVSQ